MKFYLLVPLAAIAGLIIGAWGPRAELRARKDMAREEMLAPKRSANDGFNAFTHFVRIPDEVRPVRREDRSKRKVAATNAVAAVSTSTNATSSAGNTNAVKNAARPRMHRHMSPEDLRARIEQAQELWRTRVDLARTTWKGKLGIKEERSAEFDAAIEEMNEKLLATVNDLVQLMESKESMTPELGVRLVGDASAVLAETYDRIGACVGEDQREVVSSMPLTDFVDPGVAEPLVSVQGKLGKDME